MVPFIIWVELVHSWFNVVPHWLRSVIMFWTPTFFAYYPNAAWKCKTCHEETASVYFSHLSSDL